MKPERERRYRRMPLSDRTLLDVFSGRATVDLTYLPPDVETAGAAYDYLAQCLMLFLWSAAWDVVPLGAEIPLVEPPRLTRKETPRD